MSVSPSASAQEVAARRFSGVGVEPPEPLRLRRPLDPVLGLLGQRGEGAGVAAAGVVVAARGPQLLERERADAVEHREAIAVAGDEALVHERGDPVERVGPRDRLGGLQRPAADEHAELGEQRPRVLVEQVVAPADRRAQRPLARRGVARAGA